MKRVIVTGAAGFLGANLTQALSDHGYSIYAIVRPNSAHNDRLTSIKNVTMIELDMHEILQLRNLISEKCDFFFHIAWHGEDRYNTEEQYTNVPEGLNSLRAAKELGCEKWICTGSQAEYGARNEVLKEDIRPNPFCAYGAAKVALCYMSRYMAHSCRLEWTWARIHSLYGKFEPESRMLPTLIKHLQSGASIKLSSCTQYWDYLDAYEAAEALIAIAEKGFSGEIYNIASDSCRPLKEYVNIIHHMYGPNVPIKYGSDPSPYVSLQTSIEKLSNDTGWKPIKSFEDGLASIVF